MTVWYQAKIRGIRWSVLLNLFDIDLQTHGKTWFSRNILNLTKESARDLITGRPGKKGESDEQRRSAYRDFVLLNAREGSHRGPN